MGCLGGLTAYREGELNLFSFLGKMRRGARNGYVTQEAHEDSEKRRENNCVKVSEFLARRLVGWMAEAEMVQGWTREAGLQPQQ